MERTINIQTLVDFADERKRVNPWELTDAAKCLYMGIKVVGIDNVVVTYKNSKGEKVECKGIETSMMVRAFAGYVVRLLYRWNDIDNGRLENHFGLNLPIAEVLRDTGVVKRSGADLACTNVAEAVDTWAINK